MKKYLLIALMLGSLALSALYCAPYYAVNKLQKAAVQGDLATIQKYIDFDKVRAHEQGQEASGANPDNNIVQAAVIAAILAQSMEPAPGQVALDMTMGYSGDDHFMLSLSEPMPADTNAEKTKETMNPVIFVFEQKNFYTWQVTEILMDK